ncbi:MAG: class I SAM-dependent methyltransferase, partial [bacterium]|nr:class I SAM-dependent methyltransferase [bacterium]
MSANRIEQELKHDEKILSRAEEIWGWDTPAGRKRAVRRAQYFIRLGRLTRGTKVLEIGCGTGVFTRQLAPTGASVTAIDISPDFIAKASQIGAGSNVSFKVEDIHSLSFQDETFDAVVGSSVLHHLELKPALNEIKRVLKSGGVLVFTEPNMMNPQIMLIKNVKPLGKIMGDSPGETAFFRWNLTAELLKEGFR